MMVSTYKYKDLQSIISKMLDKYFMILVDCDYADLKRRQNKINKLGFNIIDTEITGTEDYSSCKMIITRF